MRTPFLYFALGSLFTYFAYISVEDTVWNTTTVLLLLLATLEFTIGFRFLKHQLKMKNDENNRDTK